MAPMPAKPTRAKHSPLFEQVEQVIQEIRPAIQEDGGDVELVEVTSAGQVQLRFKGACIACPSRDLTLQHGIERALREVLPSVTSVTAVP